MTTNCSQLKMLAPDGKMRLRDALDTEGVFRLIESIPSPKAETFKLWLAKLGKERIDEIFDPEIAVNRIIEYYRKRGYTDDWIKARMTATLDRKKLTDIWKDNGINDNLEYAILTNEIYKTWSGMTTNQYKTHKGIRKESLRDNMTDIEVSLANLGEIATGEIAKEHKPLGLKENQKVAQRGGKIAKNARLDLEKEIDKSVISKENSLNYQYIDENKKLR